MLFNVVHLCTFLYYLYYISKKESEMVPMHIVPFDNFNEKNDIPKKPRSYVQIPSCSTTL